MTRPTGPGKPRRNPLLGAAVLKALLLRRRGDDLTKTRSLYEGILRDLSLTDEQVETYLAQHGEEVEEAIRGHGRRGREIAMDHARVAPRSHRNAPFRQPPRIRQAIVAQRIQTAHQQECRGQACSFDDTQRGHQRLVAIHLGRTVVVPEPPHVGTGNQPIPVPELPIGFRTQVMVGHRADQ